MLENFSKSIFYPAGGTDLQILLRFSDISSTVISPTLSEYLTIENYDKIFREKCAHINSYYGTSIIDYVGYEILQNDLIKNNKFIPYPNELFKNYEIQDYHRAFSHHYTKDNFIVKFLFNRTIGQSTRRLEWIALNTEGLATLISLTNLTNEHPKILCTIQTGVLEYPNSLFTRLINYLNLQSKIWVRGFWTKDHCFSYNNISISEFPPYQYKVQDYGHWYSNMGQKGLSNEENDSKSKLSRVKAFTNDLNFRTERTTVISGNNKSRILLIQGDIRSADLKQYDLIVTSERILTNDNCDNLQYWNTLSTRDQNKHYPIMTFAESLRIIQNQVENRELKKIAITPVGFEDETMFLNEFIENQKHTFELHIYFQCPLDFISLTAPNSI